MATSLFKNKKQKNKIREKKRIKKTSAVHHQNRRKKEREPLSIEKKQKTILHKGTSCPSPFLPNFLPILGRLHFGGFGEKAPMSHQFSLPFSSLMKHTKILFSLSLFSPSFISLPKSPKSNWVLLREQVIVEMLCTKVYPIA